MNPKIPFQLCRAKYFFKDIEIGLSFLIVDYIKANQVPEG